MIEILSESKAALRAAIASSIIDDEKRSSFRVHRSVFTDEAILELEREVEAETDVAKGWSFDGVGSYICQAGGPAPGRRP